LAQETDFEAACLKARRDAYKQGIARLQKSVGYQATPVKAPE